MRLSLSLALIAAPMAAGAACATDDEIAAYAADYMAKRPTAALSADGTMEDAACSAEKLAAALEPEMGPVVGWKAGLTSAPAQEAFGVSEPVMGRLWGAAMLEDGAAVPEPHGARPLFEADLILVVGDAAINDATTPEEVMASVREVRPFIELPDLMLAEGEPLDGVTITAGGVGARGGVMGAGIAVDDPAAMADALAAMTVRVTAADGAVLAEAPGAAVLGHPAHAVTWLTGKGVRFAEGDLISVGSFGPLLPPAQAGGAATVRYEGLPGDPSVSVTFD